MAPGGPARVHPSRVAVTIRRDWLLAPSVSLLDSSCSPRDAIARVPRAAGRSLLRVVGLLHAIYSVRLALITSTVEVRRSLLAASSPLVEVGWLLLEAGGLRVEVGRALILVDSPLLATCSVSVPVGSARVAIGSVSVPVGSSRVPVGSSRVASGDFFLRSAARTLTLSAWDFGSAAADSHQDARPFYIYMS